MQTLLTSETDSFSLDFLRLAGLGWGWKKKITPGTKVRKLETLTAGLPGSPRFN